MSNMYSTPSLVDGITTFENDFESGKSGGEFQSKPNPFPITFEFTDGDKVIVNTDGEIIK